MMRLTPVALPLASLGLVACTMAAAHQGVTNTTVMARMDAMSEVGARTRVLGQMTKGELPFDAELARDAAAQIAALAAKAPGLFAAPEDDPKSEARPEIWENFEDFEARSADLEAAARAAAGSVEDPATLRSALGAIGATCKACHERYRE